MELQGDARWSQELVQALLTVGGLDSGPAELARLAEEFYARTEPVYRELTPPAEAALDLAELLGAGPTPVEQSGAEVGSEPRGGLFHAGDHLVVRRSMDPDVTFRIRRFGSRHAELSSVLPVLESYGLVVVESVPMRLGPSGAGGVVCIDDIGVRTDSPNGPEALRFVPEVHGPRLVEALEANSYGWADVDWLNRLVTIAGLDWRQVSLVRTCLRYQAQLPSQPAFEQLARVVARYPDLVRSLVGYFQARFDPLRHRGGPKEEGPFGSASRERSLAAAQLDLIGQLDDYRVLKVSMCILDATVRTNFYRPERQGPAPLVLKLDPARIADLDPPRPRVETFVSGPNTEGIHLRAGLVARGGLRYSDRPADLRTEILDLTLAQVKKNAIIVPTGAKGGFVVRRPQLPGPEQVERSYGELVGGLLDVTDNLVKGQVVPPDHVVALDGPDPYLVVAADKGTASFSDLANAISLERGFWLGDAFASGGSHGYDHKKMGITAKGAWVAVRRHFRQLGVDVDSEAITCVGVGDMSGDVFGNAMLLCPRLRLVGAFDHRHVFLDPDPDPERALRERQRLFALAGSSWDDYGREAFSDGGGVWSRQARSIPLSRAAQVVLGVDASELTPPELIKALLCAPVDLLFFGGVGTFVKAPGESDAEVADHANDAVRVSADQLRARVVAEGANLAVTQAARIAYSRRGGRINADFVDNAAGVATSDREVNLKILLALAQEAHRLDADGRDELLGLCEPDVAAAVLEQVDHTVVALNRAAMASQLELDAYEALVEHLEGAGLLDRAFESLPTAEEFATRRAAGAGLIRPELAVVLAYAKSDLEVVLCEAGVEQDEELALIAEQYFPELVVDRFGDLVVSHRLRPQLVATGLAGEVVDRMGVVWAHETAAMTGADLACVAGAFWAARELTGAGEAWRRAESAGDRMDHDGEEALAGFLAETVDGLARWFIARGGGRHPAQLVDSFGAAAALLARAAEGGPAWRGVLSTLREANVPTDLAELAAGARARADCGPLFDAFGLAGASAALELSQALEQAVGLERLERLARQACAESPPARRTRRWLAKEVLDQLQAWRARAVATLASFGQVEAVATWTAARTAALADVRRLLEPDERFGTDPLCRAELALGRLERLI